MRISESGVIAALSARGVGAYVGLTRPDRRAELPCVTVRIAGGRREIMPSGMAADMMAVELDVIALKADERDDVVDRVDEAMAEEGWRLRHAAGIPEALGFARRMRYERLSGGGAESWARTGLLEVRLARVIIDSSRGYRCGETVRLCDPLGMSVRGEYNAATLYSDAGVRREIVRAPRASVELTFAVQDFAALEALGLTRRGETGAYEERMECGGAFSLRCAEGTLGGFATHTKYRVFQITGAQPMGTSSRSAGRGVGGWAVTGYLCVPAMPGLPWKETLLADGTNAQACEAFMNEGE